MPRPPSQHLFSGSNHPTLWRAFPALVLASALTVQACFPVAAGQKKREELEKTFLVFGTVFTEPGFALPGAEIRVRRAGEKKFRWEVRADRRGEFAVRVPRGAEYEVQVKAQGYQEQVQPVDAQQGTQKDLVFRLAPAPGGKKK